MAFGEVYSAERPKRLSVSNNLNTASNPFHSIESPEGESGDAIQNSSLGKALSAHFSRYQDIFAQRAESD